jgi:hypothetical protein
MSDDPHSELTVSERLSAQLSNGTTAIGRLWLHHTRRGRFEVEYCGKRKSDGHTDYTEIGFIRVLARILLRELAENGF